MQFLHREEIHGIIIVQFKTESKLVEHGTIRTNTATGTNESVVLI